MQLLLGAAPWPPPLLASMEDFGAAAGETFVRCPADATPESFAAEQPAPGGRLQSDVANYLHQQGLDPADLQAAHPEQYAALTLPLAKARPSPSPPRVLLAMRCP